MHRRTFLGAAAAVTAGLGITKARAQDAAPSGGSPHIDPSHPMTLPKSFSMDRASGAPVFTTGEMAHNKVAVKFGLIPDLPPSLSIAYDTAEGPRYFADLTGKIRILALWSEQYPVCLRELPELAALQAKYGGDRFEILAVLTGSRGPLSFSDARKAVDGAGAQALPLWAEPDGGGQTLALAVADMPPMGKRASVPCAVLVDPQGKVRGHMVGLESAPEHHHAPGPPPADPAARAQWFTDRIFPSIWATPDADAFIQGLLNGALS